MSINLKSKRGTGGKITKVMLGSLELSPCVHGGKNVWHHEEVCPVCKDAAQRGRYLEYVKAAYVDLVCESGGDLEKNDNVRAIMERIDSLVKKIHGGYANGWGDNDGHE